MNRAAILGVLALVVGVLLLIGLVAGLGRAIGGEDPSAFFVTPFLLTAALVCLGVGLHKLREARRPLADATDPAADDPADTPPPRP